uniref:Uncharacterized protein n=1 Tax=Anguilla anguilla TaxID=7936 RepID=A0A0E9RD17_ANGAN
MIPLRGNAPKPFYIAHSFKHIQNTQHLHESWQSRGKDPSIV